MASTYEEFKRDHPWRLRFALWRFDIECWWYYHTHRKEIESKIGDLTVLHETGVCPCDECSENWV